MTFRERSGKPALDSQLGELVAIGAACGANCIPCLQFHVRKARELGVEEERIREAVRIGRMVRKGATRKWDEEAAALFGSEASGAARD